MECATNLSGFDPAALSQELFWKFIAVANMSYGQEVLGVDRIFCSFCKQCHLLVGCKCIPLSGPIIVLACSSLYTCIAIWKGHTCT